jgi:hypothetical protein
MPIALRLRQGKRFRRGAWSLGRHHLWIDTLALTWIGVITILFIMPVTPDGIPFRAGFSWTVANYAPLTMVVFVLLIGGWWVLSARHWFRGPVAQGTVEELAALDDVTGAAALSPAVTDGPDPADLADRELGLGQE